AHRLRAGLGAGTAGGCGGGGGGGGGRRRGAGGGGGHPPKGPPHQRGGSGGPRPPRTGGPACCPGGGGGGARFPSPAAPRRAVRALAGRWRLAVASSAPKSLIEAVLDVSGLRPVFAAAVSSEEVERGKPAPDVYLEAAARLGVPPGDCAAVEDSSNGLRSAAA